MQVWLNDSEASALVTVVRKEATKASRRSSAAYARANKISDQAWALDSLAYTLEDAIRSELDAFDRD